MWQGKRNILRLWLLFMLIFPLAAFAQIDPAKRDLLQFGYNQPMKGKAPISGYAFYYRNQPDFFRTNMTLRLAIAPVYADSELGFAHALGSQTDLGIGVAGGGFADSYYEIDGGQYHSGQSYEGHGGELSASIYHLFNPESRIPLHYILRGSGHYSTYNHFDTTAPEFQTPGDGATFSVRTGLRWGGVEPTLFPSLAMEVSGWYEGLFRSNPGTYGINEDRAVEPSSHLFWGAGALSYTLPQSQQNISVRLVAGTSINADRLSAYRLGGFLPLVAEYPLSLPGYYYEEFSARQFALLNAGYLLPIAPDRRWNLDFTAATALVDYLPGTGQTGNSISGVGGGVFYRAPSDKFRLIVNYGYGFNAVRDGGRGASSISVLLQIDLDEPVHDEGFKATEPYRWRGWNWLFGR